MATQGSLSNPAILQALTAYFPDIKTRARLSQTSKNIRDALPLSVQELKEANTILNEKTARLETKIDDLEQELEKETLKKERFPKNRWYKSRLQHQNKKIAELQKKLHKDKRTYKRMTTSKKSLTKQINQKDMGLRTKVNTKLKTRKKHKKLPTTKRKKLFSE